MSNPSPVKCVRKTTTEHLKTQCGALANKEHCIGPRSAVHVTTQRTAFSSTPCIAKQKGRHDDEIMPPCYWGETPQNG